MEPVERSWVGYTERQIENFWRRVQKTEGCWLWTGTIVRGYGHVSINDETVKAHRVAWELANGEFIPRGLRVLHECDVRHCVRPAHLFLGTSLDNTLDMVRKGRHRNGGVGAAGMNNGQHTHPEQRPRGVSHGMTKLDEARVRVIRERFALGESQTSLSREFGINQTTVSCIVLRKTWSHVP